MPEYRGKGGRKARARPRLRGNTVLAVEPPALEQSPEAEALQFFADNELIFKSAIGTALTGAEERRLKKIHRDYAAGRLKMPDLSAKPKAPVRLKKMKLTDANFHLLGAAQPRPQDLATKAERLHPIGVDGYFPVESPAPNVDNARKTGKTGAKDEGPMQGPQQELINRIKNRPDLAIACLKFLETEITRPQYAKLSAELTEARLEKERKKEREKKARHRQRVRAAATAEPR